MDFKSNVTLIKEFFSTPGRAVTTAELKALTREDREELANLISAAHAPAGQAAA